MWVNILSKVDLETLRCNYYFGHASEIMLIIMTMIYCSLIKPCFRICVFTLVLNQTLRYGPKSEMN